MQWLEHGSWQPDDAGYKPESELDRLSNIIKAFNDQFGNIDWEDADRIHNLITEVNPSRVATDTAYRNARENSDRQNARIENNKILARIMTALMKDDTELFKQFMDLIYSANSQSIVMILL